MPPSGLIESKDASPPIIPGYYTLTASCVDCGFSTNHPQIVLISNQTYIFPLPKELISNHINHALKQRAFGQHNLSFNAILLRGQSSTDNWFQYSGTKTITIINSG